MATDATSKPHAKPATKSMIAEGGGATEPSGSGIGSTAGDRAQEMRGTLKIRQEAEALLAEANKLRQRAVADADAMVAEAETLAGELVYEARNTSQRIVAEAQERAEGIVAVARSEADEMRRETDREREQIRSAVADAVRADVERAHDGLRAVTPTLEETIGAVTGALAALEVLRGEDWTPRLALERVGPQTVADPGTEQPEPEDLDETGAGDEAATTITSLPPDAMDADGTDDARPLGWLFRSPQA